jgi:hypothetical protein
MVTLHTKEFNCDISIRHYFVREVYWAQYLLIFVIQKRIRIPSAEIVAIQILKYLKETGTTSVTK